MQWLGLSLIAVCALLCGCGHGGATAPIVVNYANATVVYTKGVAATVDYPTISSGTVTAQSCGL
jgi:hypothetical protein